MRDLEMIKAKMKNWRFCTLEKPATVPHDSGKRQQNEAGITTLMSQIHCSQKEKAAANTTEQPLCLSLSLIES